MDLSDPEIARHYMIATYVLHELPKFDWYDGCFLAKFEAARRMLEIVAPDRLARFTAAFDRLRTAPTFDVRHLRDVLPPERFRSLRDYVSTIPQTLLKSYETAMFGRHIVHDLDVLTALQAELSPIVAELAGEAVEPSYNFLSLYNGKGRCPPHLDAPSAKWTLDLCLAQSCEWPIHFGPVAPWPATAKAAGEARDRGFSQYVLRPNEAILFSGSAQWHYRDAIPDNGFCHLAFLHYRPVYTADLVEPACWATHFDIPALAVLDTVFNELRPERRA